MLPLRHGDSPQYLIRSSTETCRSTTSSGAHIVDGLWLSVAGLVVAIHLLSRRAYTLQSIHYNSKVECKTHVEQNTRIELLTY